MVDGTTEIDSRTGTQRARLCEMTKKYNEMKLKWNSYLNISKACGCWATKLVSKTNVYRQIPTVKWQTVILIFNQMSQTVIYWASLNFMSQTDVTCCPMFVNPSDFMTWLTYNMEIYRLQILNKSIDLISLKRALKCIKKSYISFIHFFYTLLDL